MAAKSANNLKKNYSFRYNILLKRPENSKSSNPDLEQRGDVKSQTSPFSATIGLLLRRVFVLDREACNVHYGT